MWKTTLIILSLAVFFVFSPYARADVWSQLWQQSNSEIWNGQEVGPFDQVAVWATDGTGMVFGDSAFSDFSVPGWTVYNESGSTGARAFSSTPLNYVQFDMNYATKFGVADFLYISAYQGEIRQKQHITYNSATGWSYPAFTGTNAEWHAMGGGDAIPVPEPPTVFLFLASLLSLCYNLRR